MLSPAVECFALFSYGFSWALIVIVALDRVFIITKGHIYKKIITQKVLNCIILIALFGVTTMAILNPMRGKFPRQVSQVIQYTQLTFETFFIFITFVAYIYLFLFVRLKSRVIANKRHCLNNFDKKLMMTVTYTYLCLNVFYCSPVRSDSYLFHWCNNRSYNTDECALLGHDPSIFKFICKCMDHSVQQS